MPEEQPSASISFAVSGDWSARDLEEFASALRGIHDSPLAVYILRRPQNRRINETRGLERWASEPSSTSLPPFIGLGQGAWDPRISEDSFNEVLSHLDFHAAETERLRIDRIHVASPGGFSFRGIGELIAQLRELIKDLWYRNNRERVMGGSRSLSGT